jgi:N-acetylglutamate synthase-like GNAT family acetyltransferase
MKREEKDPMTTGISDITGRIVRVRHATELDRFFIEELLKKCGLDTPRVEYSEFVVATENGDLVGLGRLRGVGVAGELGPVMLTEEKSRHRVGPLIVKHLLEFSPYKKVYTITDLVDFFTTLGFVQTHDAPKEYIDLLNAAREAGKGGQVIMQYDKSL